MLALDDGSRSYGRREFLRIGGLGLSGLTLSSLLAAQAHGAAGNVLRGKSVIFLFQQGGPSQFETFDPKPDALEEIRTVTGVTPTSVPGLHFGDTLQQLAKLAHKLTIVRSFATGNGEHNIVPIVSPNSLDANIGSLYSRVAGPTKAETGMPTNAVLFPQAVDELVTKGSARGPIEAVGSLGKTHAPFIPGGTGELQKNLRLNLHPDRFDDRQALLGQFRALNRRLEGDADPARLDEFQEQAYQLLLSGQVAKALDLKHEDPQVVARYDTREYVPSHNWERSARGKRGYYSGSAKTIGRLLLMARRLCEAGCGFVTVHADYEGVWDMHADGNNLNMKDGMEAVGRSFDHAVAAFIEDCAARGLSDKILLVATGEMGRTPRLNKTGGRDHWARLAPLMMTGGGQPGGRVLGRSTRDGGEPADNPYGNKHLISTILHTMFDVGQLRVQPGLGQIARLAETPPIG